MSTQVFLHNLMSKHFHKTWEYDSVQSVWSHKGLYRVTLCVSLPLERPGDGVGKLYSIDSQGDIEHIAEFDAATPTHTEDAIVRAVVAAQRHVNTVLTAEG